MIEELLPDEYRRVIVNRIREWCLLIQERSRIEQRLYYEPYAKGRKKHCVTGEILAGFAPDRFNVPGIEVIDLSYGRGLCQPELHTTNAIIQLYSNGSDLKGAQIANCCEKYNASEDKRPQFLIIVFTVSKNGILSKIEAHRPNSTGELIEHLELYSNVTSLPEAI